MQAGAALACEVTIKSLFPRYLKELASVDRKGGPARKASTVPRPTCRVLPKRNRILYAIAYVFIGLSVSMLLVLLAVVGG